MVDDILDLILMIILLGVSVGVGFSLILPMANQETLILNENIVDKSAPNILGDVSSFDYDGKLTKMEVLLQTQIQDFSIPRPKSFKVGGMSVAIEELYRDNENLQYIGITTWNELKKLDPTGNAKFSIRYNWNNTFNTEDDFYEVVKE